MRQFSKFAVIDWSGANLARPSGLAIAVASRGDEAPSLLSPPRGGWSRQDVLTWLREHSRTDILIGLDFSPGLPFVDQDSFFPGWPDSPATAKELWRSVDDLSSNERHLSANGFLSHELAREHFLHHNYRGSSYSPANGRLRRCELRQAAMRLSPSSCFKLIGANQVGKSSLTGMRVLHQLSDGIPVWPFDPIPDQGSLIVEIYTSIAACTAGRPRQATKIRTFEELNAALTHPAIGSRPTGQTGRIDDHASDAIITAAWLRRAASEPHLWQPEGLDDVAATEGWTFGVA